MPALALGNDSERVCEAFAANVIRAFEYSAAKTYHMRITVPHRAVIHISTAFSPQIDDSDLFADLYL